MILSCYIIPILHTFMYNVHKVNIYMGGYVVHLSACYSSETTKHILIKFVITGGKSTLKVVE
jgi:hypothetical protein